MAHDVAEDDLSARLERAVDGMAGLLGRAQGDRHAEWLARLQINLPELRLLDRMRPERPLGLLAPPVAQVGPGGVAPDPAAGAIAAIARASLAGTDRLRAPAMAALEVAREHASLRAFTALASDEALEAQFADNIAASRDGRPRPLLGVPIAVKDLMPVRGFVQTNGTGGTRPRPATRDAAVIARLRDAGGIFIGTTNLHEYAYGITSDNPHFGAVLNPLNHDYMPGGSSGGSAAAVAAGVVALALGTDTAGSIRLPAACCGVVGFKPSFDAVPRDGVQPLGASLDHVGPIAANVADAALAFAVMAGLPPAVPRRGPLGGLRIGVPTNYFFDPLGADVARALTGALDRMRTDGAELVPVGLPGVEAAAALQFATLCSEATDVHWETLNTRPESLGADVHVRLEIGQFLPAIWYTRAQRRRAELVAMFTTAMHGLDALVTPTVRVEPPRRGTTRVQLGGRELPLHTALTSLTMPFNLTGMPALTLPCGRGDSGLPIGLQIVGQCGDDWSVLRVAARVEDLLQYDPRRRP